MKRSMSVAELIRQDVLDMHPEPPRPPCPIPPRLLILACSAPKATGEKLTAICANLRDNGGDPGRVFYIVESGKVLARKHPHGECLNGFPCSPDIPWHPVWRPPVYPSLPSRLKSTLDYGEQAGPMLAPAKA